MNKAVYRHLLKTYGRRPGVWVGFAAEVTRVLMMRIYVNVLMAQAVSSLAAGNVQGAKRSVLLFLAMNVIGSVVGSAGDLIANRSENNLYGRLIADYYAKLASKDMAFYRDHQTGYLASMFRQYLDSGLQLVRLLRNDAVGTAISLVVPVIVLAVADWRVGLVALAIVALQFVYVIWASTRGEVWRTRSHEIYRKVTGEVSDEITNIVAFKSGGQERLSCARVGKLGEEEANTYFQRRKVAVSLDLPRGILTAFGVAGALWAAIIGVSEHSQSLGLIILTMTYMFQIMRNVTALPNLMLRHDDYITKAYPTLAYLSTEHEEIRDPTEPKEFRVTKGAIAIEHVGFSYPSQTGERRTKVFDDLNIQIAGGEQVGVVGLSGAGKSTLASLLMRFDDVTEGALKIDGVDIREVRQSELRQRIAYVPQEPLLFHRSVRENITYFRGDASDDEVVRAAKAAHAHGFISKLPKGYDTLVGERGVKLSGGQKQRVVIARAVLKNAPIMIFDEATSALDSESEQIIQRALPGIIGRHTAIVIAHRLSTVAGLDRIIVMHEGRVAETGTHDELIALGGRYAELWRKQTNGRH